VSARIGAEAMLPLDEPIVAKEDPWPSCHSQIAADQDIG
jgi:hypothetical protein